MSRDKIVVALWIAGLIAASGMAMSATPLADRDFASFWTAAKLAFNGHASGVYDRQILIGSARQWLGTHTLIAFPYPPHSLFIFVPLGLLPYREAFLLWDIATLSFFWFAARRYLPIGLLPTAFMGLSPAALINGQFGQTGFLYGALWITAFHFPIASAVLTFKPHLGALSAVEAFRKRQVVPVALAALALMSLSCAFFGGSSWVAYFKAAALGQIGMLSSGPMLSHWADQMTTPLLHYGLVGWLLFAGAATYLLSRSFNVFTAATAAFLISPYGFHYDMTVVCLGCAYMLYSGWHELAPWQRFAIGLGYLSPALVAIGLPVIPPILLACLYAQASAGRLEISLTGRAAAAS